LKIAAAQAQGKVSKAQPISITKQRVKARNLVKKEIDAKVAEMVHLKKTREGANKAIAAQRNDLPNTNTSSTSIPSSSPPEPETGDEGPPVKRRRCEDMRVEENAATLLPDPTTTRRTRRSTGTA
jgi:hypothetical protein